MTLDLLIPGLLPVLFDVECPALAMLLGRATHRPVSGSAPASAATTVSAFAQYLQQSVAELPLATWSAWGDGYRDEVTNLTDGCLWRGDPVHLFPDRDRLLLFDGSSLNLQMQESEQLLKHLNAETADWGWHWFASSPARWYLRCDTSLQLLTSALEQVVARPVDDFLPTGKDAGLLATRLTELQMSLYTCAENQRRELRGQHSINSLWLWGAGDLGTGVEAKAGASKAEVVEVEYVYTEDASILGWAMKAGVDAAPVPKHAAVLLSESNQSQSLLVLDNLEVAASYGDVMAWMQAFDGLCKDWLTPLWEAVGRSDVDKIRLWPGDGQVYEVLRKDVWRIWRRPQSLQANHANGH